MIENEEDKLLLKMMYEAEQNANVYREALLEMSLENDQLYNDYCRMYDMIEKISARICMANSCLSSPAIALMEIEKIIEVGCQS